MTPDIYVIIANYGKSSRRVNAWYEKADAEAEVERLKGAYKWATFRVVQYMADLEAPK